MCGTGLRSGRRSRQTRYAPLHPGIQDQVAQNRQESLQALATEVRFSKPAKSHFVRKFDNWRELATANLLNLLIFNGLQVEAGLPLFSADSFPVRVDAED